MKKSVTLLFLFFSLKSWAWQEDIDTYLKDPLKPFNSEIDIGLFTSASSEIRIGSYIFSDEFHVYKGGVHSEFAFINFSDRLLWLMGLGIETLIDNQNDLGFRLVKYYYLVDQSIKWRFNHNVLTLGYRHYCNHGADNALPSRIIIRSGFFSELDLNFDFYPGKLLVRPHLGFYVVGQNSQLKKQARGKSTMSALFIWPIFDPFYLELGMGAGVEFYSGGKNDVYTIADSLSKLDLAPIYSFRLGLRFEGFKVTNTISLSLAQNFDSGINTKTPEPPHFSMDINFYW